MNHPKIENHNFKVNSGDINTSLLIPNGSIGKLAVILPGAGYSCKQPLLYYSIQVLLQKKFNVLTINQVYADNPDWIKLTTMESALNVVEKDAKILFPSIAERFSCGIHTILGRSLGTYAIACGLESQTLTCSQT